MTVTYDTMEAAEAAHDWAAWPILWRGIETYGQQMYDIPETYGWTEWRQQGDESIWLVWRYQPRDWYDRVNGTLDLAAGYTVWEHTARPAWVPEPLPPSTLLPCGHGRWEWQEAGRYWAGGAWHEAPTGFCWACAQRTVAE